MNPFINEKLEEMREQLLRESGLRPGTIRRWASGEHQKQADGSWARVTKKKPAGSSEPYNWMDPKLQAKVPVSGPFKGKIPASGPFAAGLSNGGRLELQFDGKRRSWGVAEFDAAGAQTGEVRWSPSRATAVSGFKQVVDRDARDFKQSIASIIRGEFDR